MGVSSAVLKALAEKDVFEFYQIQTDRINYKGETNVLKDLNEFQEKALTEIKASFEEKEVIFLNLKDHLAPNGIVFGCSVLGKDTREALHTRLFLKLYQFIGIFNNAKDTKIGLENALSKHFTYIEVQVVGSVALFRASDAARF